MATLFNTVMKKIILLLCVTLLVQFDASAQINKLKRKLEERMTKKVTEKVEEKIEEKVDEKIEESREENDDDRPTREKPTFDLGKVMGGEAPADLEKSYAFDFQIDWVITSSDTEDPVDMSQLYSTEKKYMGMETVQPNEQGEEQEFQTILDFDKNYFMILNPESNQLMLFEFQNIQDQLAEQAEEEENQPGDDFNITKTGEKKNIAGYSCEKYIYTSGKEKGAYWVTKELKYENFDMFNYFKNLSEKQGMDSRPSYQMAIEGFMLQMTSEDEEGKRTDMIATKVDENAKRSYDLEGYQTLDLRGFSKGMGGFKN